MYIYLHKIFLTPSFLKKFFAFLIEAMPAMRTQDEKIRIPGIKFKLPVAPNFTQPERTVINNKLRIIPG
jgi:hypothetical protein